MYKYYNVSCARSSLSESDKKEVDLYASDPLESYEGDLFDNIISKANYIRVFEKLISHLELAGAETVLEVGGGHCWASTLIKRKYPECYVVASDLGPEAVRFAEKYESLLRASIDEKWSFSCRQIPFDDEQFDRVFVFSAFHHFGEDNDFSTAIKEMVRILKPTGKIVLLHEPSSPRWIYKSAFERVNRKRAFRFSHTIDEDVLILSDLKRVCEQLNCRFKAQYYTPYEEREGIVETIYYYALTRLRPLRRLLPCTVNIEIEKL